MTATITPPAGVPNLSRVDPAQREADYLEALRWYIQAAPGVFDRIVFAENSLSDVSRLESACESLAPGLVEFLVFDGLDYPPHFDRGYGEFRLLDHAMSHSPSIVAAAEADPEGTRIWKVTGRYRVRNVAEIVTGAPRRFEFYANFRNWPKRWVDTYFLGWTPEGYEALVRDVYHRLKTNVPGIPYGLSGEELFRSWLEQPLFRRRRIVKRFRSTPDLDGIRGADGRGYSAHEGWKIRLRSILRRVAPFVWI